MKIKTFMLTIILTIGISFQSCEKSNHDYVCGGTPTSTGNYFDIHGINVINYKKRGECCADPIGQGESVFLTDYSGINIKYLVDYIALNKNKNASGFSLMNSLNACTPVENGRAGSKTERLKSLYLITLNDFDSSHLANDTINDLFENFTYYRNKQDLNEYLAQDTGLIKVQELSLGLKVSPFLNNEFKYKVLLELSTGEKYQANSIPFRIIN